MNLQVKDVSKTIRGEAVLRHVSLEMSGGNVYGIYGRNGSGKTMLLRCISGMARASEGEVTCDGRTLHKDMDVLPNMGLLIENVSFWRAYSGLENLRMLAGIRGKVGEEKVRETMERIGLDPDLRKAVGKYSLGMRQKLAIAQAVMEEPDVLLLDEPTNALDEESVGRFWEMIRQERERGALIVIASHDREDLEALSDVRIHMRDGQAEEG